MLNKRTLEQWRQESLLRIKETEGHPYYKKLLKFHGRLLSLTQYALDQKLLEKGSKDDFLSFIVKSWTEQTGGGVMVDYFLHKSGKVIGITDECVCLYTSEEAAKEGIHIENDKAVIILDEFKN